MASFFTIIAITTGIIYTYSHEVIAVSGVLATALLIFYNHKSNIVSMIEKSK
jgi:hypothetical protein